MTENDKSKLENDIENKSENQLIDKHKNEIEKELKNEINSVEYFIEKSPKTNEYTLALKKQNKKKYALSKYRPREHALEKLNNMDWGNKNTVWILIGYGFGYMAEAILDKIGNHARIIVLEPNQELLNEEIKLKPISKKAPNVWTIPSLDPVRISNTLNQLIPLSEVFNISISYLDGYLEYYKLFCKIMIERISTFKTEKHVSFATILGRNRDNVLNSLKNAYYFSENNDIYHLQKICKDIPAIIVCAGPSLDKNIDEIKNFKGIIIAIGRTMTPLLKRNIRPDFVISVDPTDLIYETFGEYKDHDIPLITLTDASAKVVEHSHGEKYFMLNNAITTTIFKTHVNPHTSFYSSVSSLCVTFAEFLECNPIIIVGQDLAYPNNKFHAGDEEGTFNIQDKKMIKGFDNQLVASDEAMIAIIRWLEAQVREYPNILHINATEGGAYINGMIHMTLKEAIEKYCNKDKPEITHVKLEATKEVNYKKCIQEARNSIEKIGRLSKLISTYYKQLEPEYAKDDKKNWGKINRIYDSMEKAEKGIEKIPNSSNLITLLLGKAKLVLDVNNENKASIGEAKWEQDVRVVRVMSERYYYLARECENFIRIIDLVMRDTEQRRNEP